jgi:hypothetical protein
MSTYVGYLARAGVYARLEHNQVRPIAVADLSVVTVLLNKRDIERIGKALHVLIKMGVDEGRQVRSWPAKEDEARLRRRVPRSN